MVFIFKGGSNEHTFSPFGAKNRGQTRSEQTFIFGVIQNLRTFFFRKKRIKEHYQVAWNFKIWKIWEFLWKWNFQILWETRALEAKLRKFSKYFKIFFSQNLAYRSNRAIKNNGIINFKGGSNEHSFSPYRANPREINRCYILSGKS